jgi:hypothetical protein
MGNGWVRNKKATSGCEWCGGWWILGKVGLPWTLSSLSGGTGSIKMGWIGFGSRRMTESQLGTNISKSSAPFSLGGWVFGRPGS